MSAPRARGDGPDLLIADRSTPTWDIITGVPPRIKVEPKDDVTARLGRSPDRGDAVCMAFWAESIGRLSAEVRNTFRNSSTLPAAPIEHRDQQRNQHPPFPRAPRHPP